MIVDTAQAIGLRSGDGPTSYSEIACWCSLSDIDLSLWEVETVRELSAHYIERHAEFREAESTPPPYMSDIGRLEYNREMERRADAALENAARGTAQRENR